MTDGRIAIYLQVDGVQRHLTQIVSQASEPVGKSCFMAFLIAVEAGSGMEVVNKWPLMEIF